MNLADGRQGALLRVVTDTSMVAADSVESFDSYYVPAC